MPELCSYLGRPAAILDSLKYRVTNSATKLDENRLNQEIRRVTASAPAADTGTAAEPRDIPDLCIARTGVGGGCLGSEKLATSGPIIVCFFRPVEITSVHPRARTGERHRGRTRA